MNLNFSWAHKLTNIIPDIEGKTGTFMENGTQAVTHSIVATQNFL